MDFTYPNSKDEANLVCLRELYMPKGLDAAHLIWA